MASHRATATTVVFAALSSVPALADTPPYSRLRGSQCRAAGQYCGEHGVEISIPCCGGTTCQQGFGTKRMFCSAESTCLAKNDVCGHGGFVISKQCCPGLECKVASYRDPLGDMKCKPSNPFDLRAASDPMPAPSDNVTLAESTMQHSDEAGLNASSGFEDAPLEMPGCLAEAQVCGSGGFKTSKQCCSGMECVPPSSYNPFGDMLCKLRK